MADVINVKELFSYLPVEKLKELAQKHNVLVAIKSPTSMLKAELVKALSDKYIALVGNELLPIQQKYLTIDKKDIPGRFFPSQLRKNPLFTTGKQDKKMQELIAKEDAKAAKYRTKEKLDEAIAKREKRAKKAKEARAKKKEEGAPAKIVKKASENIALSDKGKEIYNLWKDYFDQAEQLEAADVDASTKRMYNILIASIHKANLKYEKAKKDKSITADDKKAIDKVADKLQAIIDNVLYDKFETEED